MISLIVAHDKNRLIGSNNSLPWYLPNDLSHFKKITTGNIVVMGKNTYESIGKPLSNRINVILTRDNSCKIEGCIVSNSIHKLLQNICVEEEIFIIGGANVYSQFMTIADKLYVTYIDHQFEGDTYFPEYESNFKLIGDEKGMKDDKNPYDYYFREYVRK
ncbi:dihydrofolate reductase [Paenibacillus naphthalenovorans]|uniref:Dihydrofolate reductase n=1 Tax=Paenibacillus naphthalenovorans TaxID=162209 RepID=A0A0U2W9R5_9BACL|nr:dihydrofolate reductase [Paenibacillus naphthalenovorans]ALS22106.1 dihydrofolate reductase [Paenibacillus naphthalenovorans]